VTAAVLLRAQQIVDPVLKSTDGEVAMQPICSSSSRCNAAADINLISTGEKRMADTPKQTGEMQKTLGLGGITINAMALIAPGAFLWTTYEEQSAWGAQDMWLSVAVATFVALMTASCYALLAKQYPQGGAGSSYFYAEAAFLEKESHSHFKLARIAKLIIGSAAHLYYWVYPGVMVSFMGTLLIYIGQIFNPNFATAPAEQIAICCIFAVITGIIAFIGVNGSTMTNTLINIIQIVVLIIFSILAIAYRNTHPALHYIHGSVTGVIGFHSWTTLIFQSTIAILLVVGFESATALAAEAKNPERDIPRGVILSLVIQAVIFYLFEYFAANYFCNTDYQGAVDKNGANFTVVPPGTLITDKSLDPKIYAGGSIETGLAAAASDSAPIGSFSRIIGDAFGHHGQLFVLVSAASVTLALIGTTLSCLNTGVRVTYAMGKDNELPGLFGGLHGKTNTPHNAIILLTIISALLGSYGVLNADNLLKITLISNLGTFLLYGMTCIATYIAFSHIKDANPLTTKVIPVIGAFLNFGLMVGDVYFAFGVPTATASTKADTITALVVTVAFMVIAFAYMAIRSSIMKVPMFLPPDHKESLVDSLN
jgi:APA family basic amino acid/polyamine antiporter